MADGERLRSACPECGARLVVDRATGEVISHRPAERPPGGGTSFEGLLAGIDTERAEAEDVFDRAMAAEKDRDRLLEEKFREAMGRARESPEDEPPPRPFDHD